MKKIIGILVALMMCFTLSSCVTEVQAQSDDIYYEDNIDVRLVITYGTPYYNAEGLILYYVYHNMYYYPYFYNDRYYFHRYHSPLPRHRLGIYKPVPRDFYRHGQPPSRHHGDVRHHRNPPRNRNVSPRPNGNQPRHSANPRPSNRPNSNIGRPSMSSRPSPSVSRGSVSRPSPSSSPSRGGASSGGRFGGRR